MKIGAGQVQLDGHDIKTLKLNWLRQQIGLVSQEPALFATTIKENILLGRPDATLVEVEEAARVANAHSFIVKLPDGFDTQVSRLIQDITILTCNYGSTKLYVVVKPSDAFICQICAVLFVSLKKFFCQLIYRPLLISCQ